MGCYDTIIVKCPHCGEDYYGAQSKSGACVLRSYELADAPDNVMEDANRHAPFVCPKCRRVFEIDIEKRVAVKLPITEEYVRKNFDERMNSGNPALGRTEVEKVVIAMNTGKK